MKKFTREDILKIKNLLDATSHSDPPLTTPTELTGKALMDIADEFGLNLTIKITPFLSNNTAWLVGKELFVSKDTYEFLDDADTVAETMKCLLIVVLPKLPQNSIFDPRNDLPAIDKRSLL